MAAFYVFESCKANIQSDFGLEKERANLPDATLQTELLDASVVYESGTNKILDPAAV